MAKKAAKKKVKKEEPPPEIIDEFTSMDAQALQDNLDHYRKKLSKCKEERNYVALEKDMIESFYDITKKEVGDLEAEILNMDRKMEQMEENHRVEIKVYVQKVKHLEYEQRNNVKKVKMEGESSINTEAESHNERDFQLKKDKRSLKMELKERALANEEEIKQLKQLHEKNLIKLREEFQKNHDNLKSRYDEKLQKLKEDLELRRKVEIHEIEERKNRHINELMRNHEKAFNQIKGYYNDITYENLQFIKELKKDIADMKEKEAHNQKLMYNISEENKQLSVPLAEAREQREALEKQLANYKKDKMSLRNAKARLLALNENLKNLKLAHVQLEEKYHKMQLERDEIYVRFEEAIDKIRRQAEYKNAVLEKKLAIYAADFERKQVQLEEVLKAAPLDSGLVSKLTRNLEEVLDGKNRIIEELKYELAHAVKAYNDSIRVYEAKLVEFGIPPEELNYELIPSSTSSMPAGLVAA